MEHELDEWRYAVRDMFDHERLATAMELRASAGLSTADAEDDQEDGLWAGQS